MGEHERILYIGKAVSLRSRVRSYFQDSAAHVYRTTQMVARVVDVRWIVVTNEIEALILEANLIKRHQPPFNVRLRDDKRYPYLKVTNEAFPRVQFTRVVRDDGAPLFRPIYERARLARTHQSRARRLPASHVPRADRWQAQTPVFAVSHQTLSRALRRFQTEPEYDALVDEVVLFLEGHQERLLERLHQEMNEAADRMNYEAAGRLRDRIVAVRRVTEKQTSCGVRASTWILIASARSQGQACMQVFLVRGGKLIGQEHFILEGVTDQSDAELYREFFTQYYTARSGTSMANVPSLSAIGDGFSPLALRNARDNEVPVAIKARSRRSVAQATIPKKCS